MANICWEKIYESRDLIYTKEQHVSKTQNKHKRTEFKPMTFGAIYGMRDKKAAEQLGVTQEEGQIVVETIKKEIPVVFSMVENASKFALKHGYVVHNTRTNSRRWFMPVVEAIQYLKEMKRDNPYDQVPGIPFYIEYNKAQPKHLMRWSDATNAESQARNTRIQGTQADMVKEAIVSIATDIRSQKLDLVLLGTVHDELIYKHPIGYEIDGMSAGEWISLQMRTIANLYLEGVVEMGADYETCETWTK